MQMPDEQEILTLFKRGEINLAPVSLEVLERPLSFLQGRQWDAILRVGWENSQYDFGVEIKSQSTPKIFQEAINQTVKANCPPETYPMLVMPYLSDTQLRELESRKISGIDLCGNGVIVVPGTLLVFRSGAPNKYPSSAPIKNIYRGTSSLVARVFLLRPEYPTVGEIVAEIARRGGSITFSTVSRALKALEEDLIVGRKSGRIRLLQPEKLLDKLVANYKLPDIKRYYHGKVALSQDELMSNLNTWAIKRQLRMILTGIGSVSAYAVMAKERMLSLYCPEQFTLLAGIPAEETEIFPNIEILETVDETVYFDERSQGIYSLASPIQTYLELMHNEKRFRDTAEQVKTAILDDLRRYQA